MHFIESCMSSTQCAFILCTSRVISHWPMSPAFNALVKFDQEGVGQLQYCAYRQRLLYPKVLLLFIAALLSSVFLKYLLISYYEYWYICRSTVFPSVPTQPRHLTRIGALTGGTVELNWLPPLHPNGAIHYEIEYLRIRPAGNPVNAGTSSSPYFTLTLPNENRMYFVTVLAVNSKGRARSRIIITVTKTGMYKCKQSLRVENTQQG